jgi:uncharacterized membrane protein
VLKHFISAIFIAAYPALVHASLLFAMPNLQIVALILFFLGIFGNALIRGSGLAWLIFSSLSIAVLLLGYFSLTLYLLYITPVVIPLGLLILFGRTLFSGRKPFITAISESVHGPLPPVMQQYTRLLTKLWCAIFFIIFLWSAILPWLQRPELWSWFTNVINYGFVGAFFVIEFIVRKRLFPEHNHPSVMKYIHIIIQSNIRR